MSNALLILRRFFGRFAHASVHDVVVQIMIDAHPVRSNDSGVVVVGGRLHSRQDIAMPALSDSGLLSVSLCVRLCRNSCVPLLLRCV